MKRKVVYILLSMIIAASLCACGDTAMENEVVVTNTPAVTVAPTVSPKVDNGVVTDKDGVIEDNMPDDGIVLTSPTPDSAKANDGAKASSQPKTSAKPATTAKP